MRAAWLRWPNTGWKSKIILDSRAGAGLAANGDFLDNQRSKPLGCAVHGGGTRPDLRPRDDQVKRAAGQAGNGQPEIFGERPGGHSAQHHVADEDHRQLGWTDTGNLEKLVCGRVLVWLEPLVGDATADQVFADAASA